MVIMKTISYKKKEFVWTLSRWFVKIREFFVPRRAKKVEITEDNNRNISDEGERILEQLKYRAAKRLRSNF
jgi:hypothetical protein